MRRPHRDQPLRFNDRQRPHQERVQRSRHGRVRADAERERGNRDGGERRRAPQLPQPIPDIAADVVKPAEPALHAPALSIAAIAELAFAPAPRLLVRMPRRRDRERASRRGRSIRRACPLRRARRKTGDKNGASTLRSYVTRFGFADQPIAADRRLQSATSSVSRRRPAAVSLLDTCLAVVVRDVPFRRDQALMLEPVERGIQRALLDVQLVARTCWMRSSTP